MIDLTRRSLTHDLVLPTILFAALGGMAWAVRGCSGFGAVNGCLFAGILWATAWWFIAREPQGMQPRRYTSGWILLAMTLGIGLAGGRGWMQWPSFWAGQLLTDAQKGQSVPIDRMYGYLWLFIAGVPWAGLGACGLAWCGSERSRGVVRFVLRWTLRIACGVGAYYLGAYLFRHYPQYFLPLYDSMKAQYADALKARKMADTPYPNLFRLINDNRAAIQHLSVYLGLLLAEILRRDWKNTILILTVGIVNGLGWALLQNWHWAHSFWPKADFNFWRCWESSGGISIGIAYGLAYFLVNRPMSDREAAQKGPYVSRYPNLQRLGASLGLIFGLTMAIKNGLKGWFNIYVGNEHYWDQRLWNIARPVALVCILAALVWIFLVRRRPKDYQGDVFPYAYAVLWVVLVIQNIIAQLITGPLSNWNEVAFSLYYVLLFLISAVIVVHFQYVKTHSTARV